MIRCLLCLCFIYFYKPFLLYSQQFPLLANYQNLSLLYNPATLNRADFANAIFLHRNQWVGFPGAPKLNGLLIQAPIQRENAAVNLIAMNEEVGVVVSNFFQLGYSYRFNLTSSSLISMGLQGGIYHFNIDANKLNLKDGLAEDAVFMRALRGIVLPLFSFGAVYRKNFAGTGIFFPRHPSQLTLGLSFFHVNPLNQINQNFSEIEIGQNINLLDSHYFLFLDYKYFVANQVQHRLSTLVKYVASSYQWNLSYRLYFKSIVWLGTSIRDNGDLGFDTGFLIKMNKKSGNYFKIGYAFETPLVPKNRFLGQSHELFLQYYFRIKPKIKCIGTRNKFYSLDIF